MFYGLAAAWALLAVYAGYLASREGRIRKELDNLRKLVEHKERKA